MVYVVETPAFTGPFDVLLQMAVRRQVDLQDLSLAEIAAEFVAGVDPGSGCDLEVSTHFLVVAAALVEIKARRLIDGGGDDGVGAEFTAMLEQELLLARLVQSNTFQKVGQTLSQLAADAQRSNPRQVGPTGSRFQDLAPDLLAGVTPLGLRAAYLRALEPEPDDPIDVAHIAPIAFTVDGVADELAGVLSRAGRVSFGELIAGIADRIEVVVRFLAALELVKRGQALLEQAGTFGEILIVWDG